MGVYPPMELSDSIGRYERGGMGSILVCPGSFVSVEPNRSVFRVVDDNGFVVDWVKMVDGFEVTQNRAGSDDLAQRWIQGHKGDHIWDINR